MTMGETSKIVNENQFNSYESFKIEVPMALTKEHACEVDLSSSG